MKRFVYIFLFLLGSVISANAQCDSTFTFSPTVALCPQDTITFTANAPNNAVTSFSWNFGDMTTGSGKTVSHTYPYDPMTSSYQVILTVTDTSGTMCMDTATIQVLPTDPLSIGISPSNVRCTSDTLETQFAITFSIDSSHLADGPFTWDFGDGNTLTSAALVVTHTFDCYGSFNVTATANGVACSGWSQIIHFYLTPISAHEIIGQPIVCDGHPIVVLNQSDSLCNNINFFTWNWGQYGPTYTLGGYDDQSYVYDLDTSVVCDPMLGATGINTSVTLTAHNVCASHFSNSQITIKPAPWAFFPRIDTLCLPFAIATPINESCPLTSSLYNDPTEFCWDFGDPTTLADTSNLENPTYQYDTTGTYTIRLIAKNSCGADTFQRQVVVIDSPSVTIVPSAPDACAGDCISFTNTTIPDPSEANTTFFWSVVPSTGVNFQNPTTNTSAEPVICFNQPGIFTINLLVSNACGIFLWQDVVQIYDVPDLTLDPLSDTCGVFVLDTLGFMSNDYGAPITSYEWEFGNASPGSASGISFPPIDFFPGNDTVILTVGNICGFSSDTVTFFSDTVTTVFAGNDTTLCQNDSGPIFTGSPMPGFWQGPGVNPLTGKFIPDTLGLYELIYTYQAASCKVYDTLFVTVVDTPTVTAMPDTSLCIDSTVTISLSALPLGGTWTGPPGLLQNGNEFVADTSGTFCFIYHFTDTTGCEGSDKVFITVNPLPPVNAGLDLVYCLVPDTLTLPTPSPPGGIWDGIGIIDPMAGTYVPGLLGMAGMDTLTYTVTSDSGCVNVDSLIVTVVIGDNADTGPGDTLCWNHGLDTLSGFNPGGGYFRTIPAPPNLFIDSTLGIFNTLDLQLGDNIVEYIVAAGTSCEARDTTTIFIRDTLAVNVGPDIIVCEGDPNIFLTGQTPPGGLWSGMGIVDAVTGEFSPDSIPPNGTAVISYTVVHPNGCNSHDELEIFVSDLPVASFSVPANSCEGSTVFFTSLSTGASIFEWDFGDMSPLSMLENPTHIYTDSGVYVFTLTVEDIHGCVDDTSGTIIINEPPDADFSISPDDDCYPFPVLFTDNSTPAGGSYLWDLGNGNTSTLSNPGPITYNQGTVDTTYYISLSITNECDTDIHQDSVRVRPLPQVDFNTNKPFDCSPFEVDFGNTTLGEPDSFFWYKNLIHPDSLISTDSVPPTQILVTDTLPDTCTFILVAQNDCGFDTLAREVIVYPNTVVAFFNIDQPIGCAPHTVTFTGYSEAPFVSWEIDGTFPSGNTTSYTFTSPGVYTITHFANNGCSYDTTFDTVIVYAEPAVSFVVDDTIKCAVQDSFQFTNQSIGTTAYLWDFGDGNTSTALDPGHAYQNPGTYLVTLVASADTNGCGSSFSRTVEVRPLPPAYFNLSDTTGCPGLQVSFDSVPPGLNYLWDFGDGTGSSIQANPVHTYADSGTFQVSLKTTDTHGCMSDTAATVIIYEEPQAGFMALEDSLCGVNSLVEFQDQSISNTQPLVYEWTFGDGNGAAVQNPTHIYGFTGLFNVQQTVRTLFGCVDSVSHPVEIFPIPTAGITQDTISGCVPFDVNFVENSSNATGWQWEIVELGLFFTGPSFSYSFTIPDDSFTIVLYTDTAGLCFDTISTKVYTASHPTAGFSMSGDEFCGPESVQFMDTSQSTRPYIRVWDFGDGSPPDGTPNPLHNYLAVDIYSVSLTITNDYGCVDIADDIVTIHPEPVAGILADTLDGCVPFTVNFVDNSTDASGWFWDVAQLDSFYSPAFTYTFTDPDQSFVVSLIVDTADFCFDTTAITIRTASEPIAIIDNQTGQEFCDDATINFADISQSTRPHTQIWDFGDNSTLETGTNVSHFYDTPGTYVITLSIENDFGCMDQTTDTIHIYPTPLAGFFTDTLNGCIPLTVNFTDNSINASGWFWDVAQLDSFYSPTFSYTFTDPDQSFLITLVVDSADFCFDTATVVIETASEPIAIIDNQTGHEFCDSVTIQFADISQSTRPHTQIWDFGDGSPPETGANVSHLYDTTGTFVITLSIENDFGCTDQTTDTIHIYPTPIAGIITDTLNGCIPLTVNFTDNSTNASGWFWDVAQLDSFYSPAFSYIFNDPDQSFLIILIVDSADFCFDTTTVVIETASEPIAMIDNLTGDRFCDNATLNFEDITQSTRPHTQVWDFGDGSMTETGTNVSHTYPDTGIFIITLSVENDFGCRDTTTDTIQVYPIPVADIQVDTLAGCVPFTVCFTDNSTDASGWFWDVAQLDSFDVANFCYDFLAPDQAFDVQLIVDTADFCFDTTNVLIRTASWPVAQLDNLTGTRFCDVAPTIELNDISQSTRTYTREWKYGDGSPNDTTQMVSHDYPGPGVYPLCLAIVNDFGCRDTARDTITIYPQPVAEIGYDPAQGCTPLEVCFENLSQNFSSTAWNFGYQGANSNQLNPCHTYFFTDTTFFVTLEVDTADFCFDRDTVSVELASYPRADFEPSSRDTCGPAVFSFTNLSTTDRFPIAWFWDFGNGDISSLEHPEVFYDSPGEYTVKLKVVNTYGCADSIEQVITVYPQPQALFDADPTSGCEFLEVNFTDLSTDATTWQWDFGDGTGSDFQNPPTHSYGRGIWTVRLMVSYEGQCFDTLEIADMIAVDRSPIADFRYKDLRFNDKPSGDVSFVSHSVDAAEIIWYMGDGTIIEAVDSFVHRYTVNDSFLVRLIVTNDLGCTDTMDRQIEPLGFGCLQVPNAMAPQAGPGEYALFYPKGVGLIDYEIAVYTIWGDRIWQSTSLVDGIPDEWWDGTINGKVVTSDVFVWKVHRAVFVGGRDWPGPREGTITVIR